MVLKVMFMLLQKCCDRKASAQETGRGPSRQWWGITRLICDELYDWQHDKATLSGKGDAETRKIVTPSTIGVKYHELVAHEIELAATAEEGCVDFEKANDGGREDSPDATTLAEELTLDI